MIFRFLLVVVVSIYIFVKVTEKYKNPYKLYYIFGKKGSGKSCFMVRKMLKYQRKGWIIYTDIEDINIPGVRIIKTLDIDTFRPEANSAVFLDEVGISYDNRDFKNFPKGRRDFYKFQRKYKVLIYMNSQSFDVDKKIRDLIDMYYLQTSINECISVSRPIIRTVKLTEASGDQESRVADQLKFAPIWQWGFYWMPHYWQYFDSFAAPERDLIPYVEVSGVPHISIKDLYQFIR